MKKISKSASYNPFFCLILIALLIYGCGNEEAPEVTVVSEEVKAEADTKRSPGYRPSWLPCCIRYSAG